MSRPSGTGLRRLDRRRLRRRPPPSIVSPGHLACALITWRNRNPHLSALLLLARSASPLSRPLTPSCRRAPSCNSRRWTAAPPPAPCRSPRGRLQDVQGERGTAEASSGAVMQRRARCRSGAAPPAPAASDVPRFRSGHPAGQGSLGPRTPSVSRRTAVGRAWWYPMKPHSPASIWKDRIFSMSPTWLALRAPTMTPATCGGSGAAAKEVR